MLRSSQVLSLLRQVSSRAGACGVPCSAIAPAVEACVPQSGLIADISTRSATGSSPAWGEQATRMFSSQAASTSDSSTATIGNEKVQKLADEILGLTVLESSWLTEILRKKLNLSKPAFGAMPAFPMAAGAAMPAPGAAPAAAPAAAAKPEEKKEKTEFDIKLESFTADGKIKVIKEIRALTNLGLKEAKELVEKAPVVVKAGVAKADAENFKKLIETAGGKVSLA